MFNQLVVSGRQEGTHKRWTVATSFGVQLLIVGVMILIPLIYTEALPKGMLNTFLVAPAPPPPPPPPAAPVKQIVRPRIVTPQRMVAPTVIPKKVEIVKDEAPDVAAAGVEGGIGVPGGAGGVLGGIIGGPAPPPPPKAATPSRIRVGGNVQGAKLIRQVQPVYPQIAKTAHVSGTVRLHAVISKDGSIQELEYVSGPALLMRAAMDAVHEWKYQPTLLNGEPVEVDTTIDVVFTLGS
jgi:periplasmic protein TonB